MMDVLDYISVFTYGAYFFTAFMFGMHFTFDIMNLRGNSSGSPLEKMCGISMLFDSLIVLGSMVLGIYCPENYGYLKGLTEACDIVVAYMVLLTGEVLLLDGWPTKRLVLTQIVPVSVLFLLQATVGPQSMNIPAYCMLVVVAMVYIRQIILMRKHDRGIKDYYSDIQGRTMRWYINITRLGVLESVLWLLFYVLGITGSLGIIVYNLYMIVFWIIASRFVLHQSAVARFREIRRMKSRQNRYIENVVQEREELAGQQRDSDISTAALVALVEDESNYGNQNESVLENEEIDDSEDTEKYEQCQQVQHVMETEKLYLNPELDVSMLAHRINTNRTYLSQYINKVLDTTFYDFVNGYRMKEAEKLLKDSETKIEHIAYACGFSSAASFIRVFRRYHGCTPAKWREGGKSTAA